MNIGVWKTLFKSLRCYDEAILTTSSDKSLSINAQSKHGCVFAELRFDGDTFPSDITFSANPKQLYDRLALFGENSKVNMCCIGRSLYIASELSGNLLRCKLCDAKEEVMLLRQPILCFEVNLTVDSVVLDVIDRAIFLGYGELRLTTLSDELTISFGENDICYYSKQQTALCEVDITLCARRMRDALALSNCESVVLSLGKGLPVKVCHSYSSLSAVVYVAPLAKS